MFGVELLFIEGLEDRTWQHVPVTEREVHWGPGLLDGLLQRPWVLLAWSCVNGLHPYRVPGVHDIHDPITRPKSTCVSHNSELHKAWNTHQCLKALGANWSFKAFYHLRPSLRGPSWSYPVHILLQALGFQWGLENPLNCGWLFNVSAGWLTAVQISSMARKKAEIWLSDWKLLRLKCHQHWGAACPLIMFCQTRVENVSSDWRLLPQPIAVDLGLV